MAMPCQLQFVPVAPGVDHLAQALPSEFHSVGINSGAPPEPELKLMAMILEDAIGCYLRYGDAKSALGRRELHAAERWLFSRDHHWIFSFENICSHLGTDAEFVRGQIRAGRLNESLGRRRQPAADLDESFSNPAE